VTEAGANTGEGGFALLDVLVALAVAGLAGSVLAGLVAFADRDAHETGARSAAHDSLLAADRILRLLTEDAHALLPNDPANSRPHGTESEFTTVSLGPRVFGLDQPARFSLRVEGGSDKKALVLAWRDPASGQDHREAVTGALETGSLKYFGQPKGADARRWLPSWKASDGQLEAIRLTIRPAASRSVTELVVPLRAHLPAACLRDPRLAGCERNMP
jgi:hypothetical protein